MYFFHDKTNKGFTLIELLVVVSIISFLSSIVISSVQDARALARDTKRMQDIIAIAGAFQAYHLDNNTFPPGKNSGMHINPDCKSDYSAFYDDADLQKILPVIPSDPLESIDTDNTKLDENGCQDDSDGNFFYGWDDDVNVLGSSIADGYCLSINKLETGAKGPIAQKLLQKFANFGVEERSSPYPDGMRDLNDGGNNANIRNAHFNVCFGEDF